MATLKQIVEDIFIGYQPVQQDLKQAKAQGIRTVIDLRMPGESHTDILGLASLRLRLGMAGPHTPPADLRDITPSKADFSRFPYPPLVEVETLYC